MVKKKAMCSLQTDVPGADIGMIKIRELHDFKEHPFKIERNQELFELRRSIQQEGILVPLLVRKNPDGEGFEIIAGHRRKEAALWAGIKEVPAIICTMDDDQAVIAMIDSNLQREKILPSEKAFAYKMRLQAMNRQGKRKELSSAPLEPKCIEEMVEISLFEADVSENGKVNIKKTNSAGGYRSNEQLARMVGESVTQIKRYIRLTKLIPKILDMVDRELLAIHSAVEISFLTEEEQYELHAVMELEYKSGEQMLHIGKYGFLRRDYLKNCKRAKYQVMLLKDTLGEHLLEIDRVAKEREEIILKQLEKSDPLPDKEDDHMAWVRAVNQHRAIAEEMILAELIYVS